MLRALLAEARYLAVAAQYALGFYLIRRRVARLKKRQPVPPDNNARG